MSGADVMAILRTSIQQNVARKLQALSNYQTPSSEAEKWYSEKGNDE
jgi:hypothetical protein